MRHALLFPLLALLLSACTAGHDTQEVPAKLRSIYHRSLFLLVRDDVRGHDVVYFRHYDTLRIAFGAWKKEGDGWRFSPKRIRLQDSVSTQALDDQPDSVRLYRLLLYEDSYWRARAGRIHVTVLDSMGTKLTGGMTDHRGFILLKLPAAGKHSRAAWLAQRQERLAQMDSLQHTPQGVALQGELLTDFQYPVPRGVSAQEPLLLQIHLKDGATRALALPAGNARIRYYLDSQLEPMNVMEGTLEPLLDDRKLHYQLTIAQPLTPPSKCQVRDMTNNSKSDLLAYE